MDNVNPEDVLEAIRDGAKDAILKALDGMSVDVFLAEIREGVRLAFDQLWPSQIRDAIEAGVESAMKRED